MVGRECARILAACDSVDCWPSCTPSVLLPKCVASVLDLPPAESGTNMKKKPADTPRVRRPARVAEDELLPEYSLRGSQPSPYAARLRDAVIAVTLDPDVAVAFPDSRSVNRALRTLLAAKPRHTTGARKTR